MNHTRNELVVTVTPHIMGRGKNAPTRIPPLLDPPSPEPLPTLDPVATLPPTRSARAAVRTLADRSLSDPPPSGQAMTGGGGPITPAPQANSATPAPLPSAFAQTNTFTFAAAPSNNYADPNAPPQIFFIQVQPTLVKNGRPVTLSAITTTNVTSLSFGPSSTATQFTLASIGPGKWQSTFNFSTNGLADLVGNATETLTAATALGASAKQSIPFTVVPH